MRGLLNKVNIKLRNKKDLDTQSRSLLFAGASEGNRTPISCMASTYTSRCITETYSVAFLLYNKCFSFATINFTNFSNRNNY